MYAYQNNDRNRPITLHLINSENKLEMFFSSSLNVVVVVGVNSSYIEVLFVFRESI